MAGLSQTMDMTLKGSTLGPGAQTQYDPNNTPETASQVGLTPDSDPEVQRVKAAYDKLVGMMESGQLKVNDNIRQMFEEEHQKLANEPTVQGPSPGNAFAAGFGALAASHALNNPGIAAGVFDTLEQRRREALASNQGKIANLRDLRLQELQHQSAEAQKAGDTKAALQAEEEKATLQAKMEKEGRQRAAQAKTQEQQFELQKIRALNEGRENVARIHVNQKLDDIIKGYNVPAHVAQMMKSARDSITSSTDRYILAKGGMNMIDAAELERLQAKERADMDASDQRILDQYKQGRLTPKGGTVPGAPGAGSVNAPAQKSEHQKTVDEIRKNALGG